MDLHAASVPPVIPIGLDAYRMWDRWAQIRIGARAYMRSTYDRQGGNHAVDASHFLRQDAADRNVALEVEGQGAMYFMRTNHWHGSPWHYVVDAHDTVVKESSTDDPLHPVAGSVFLPERPFPSPLTFTWATTKGADLMWVPIPFERSLAVSYERTHYGTGYFIYHLFPKDALHLSRPLRAWDPTSAPDADVLDLVQRAGQDIAPAGDGVTTLEGTVALSPSATATLAELDGGPTTVRRIRLRVGRDQARALGNARLRIFWDDRSAPSVDAPVALFFGTGSLYNRENREYLVKGFPMSVRFDAADVILSVYFPMPFQRRARIELVGGDQAVPNVRWQVRTQRYTDPSNWAGYFHATYQDHGTPVPGHSLVFLDTKNTEGGGDWCGSFVGTSFIFSDRAVLTTLEGDPRFYFDDSQSPQGQGTGTEEWGGGGDYWGGNTMTLPFAGHPVGARNATEAHNEEDKIQSAYRFLLADLMPFGKNARILFEHGAHNDSTEHYRTVTYWYGLPSACLVLTDSFHVGDAADEQLHGYTSPTAGAVETVSSRYELGVDHLQGVEIFPPSTDTGRRMTGISEFRLEISPANVGVLLRRKLDYELRDQRAEVEIADDRDGALFVPAGTWYLAGANRYMYSNPAGELGATEHIELSSNRRWREDEFLLPPQLTQGRAAIRVRIRSTPTNRKLFPGAPGVAPQAWSEYRYWAYSYVMPLKP